MQGHDDGSYEMQPLGETKKELKRSNLLKQLIENQKYLLPLEALRPSFVFSKVTEKQINVSQIGWSLAQLSIFFGMHNKMDEVANGVFVRTKPSFTYSADDNCVKLKNDVFKESGRELALVISVTESFELFNPSTLNPSHYAKQGVAHYLLPWRDHTADVHPQALAVAAQVAHEFVKQGKSVLIHCNAGKGRSVALALTYLMSFGDSRRGFEATNNLNSAYAHLSERRIQAQMGDEKKQRVNEAIKGKDELIEKRKYEPDPADPMPVFKRFLSSLELKNAVAQTYSLKKLNGYFNDLQENSSAATGLLAFTKSIIDAVDDSWYAAFQTRKSEGLNDFLNDPSPKVNQGRDRMIAALDRELDAIMLITFKCTAKQLEQYKSDYLKEYEKSYTQAMSLRK